MFGVFLLVMCALPFAMFIYNILLHGVAIVVIPIMEFIEGIFGEDIFERADYFLNVAIWVLGFIRTIVIGIIAFTSL